jgi:hypothetical protein
MPSCDFTSRRSSGDFGTVGPREPPVPACWSVQRRPGTATTPGAGPDQGLSLLLEPRRDRRPFSIEQRQQRLLAGQAIHELYRLALQDATVDQLIESLDSRSPFGQYAASELRYRTGRSAMVALDNLSAARCLDSLE